LRTGARPCWRKPSPIDACRVGLDPTTGRGTTGRGTTRWPGRAGSGRWIPPSPAPLPGGPPHAPCRSSSGPDGDHAGCGGRSAAALPPAEMTVPRPGPPPRQDPSRSHRRPRPGGNPRSHRARPSSSPRPTPPGCLPRLRPVLRLCRSRRGGCRPGRSSVLGGIEEFPGCYGPAGAAAPRPRPAVPPPPAAAPRSPGRGRRTRRTRQRAVAARSQATMISTAKPSSSRHAEPAPEKIARPGVTLPGAADGPPAAAVVVKEASYTGRKR